jgi:hypothetical protein
LSFVVTSPILNTPVEYEEDKTVQIIDPHHPLYNKSFLVVSDNDHSSRSKSVLVLYREGIILRIPISSTNLSGKYFAPGCKISISSVNELITLANETFLCPVIQKISGNDCLLKSSNKSNLTSQ